VIPGALLALGALAGGAAVTAWLEPRLVGPGELGPARPVERAVRVLPHRRDRWLHAAAPFAALLAAAWSMVVIPWGRGLVAADLGVAAFYFLVVADLAALGVALGGWGANTADAVEAAYRAVAQLVAYVVPLGLGVIGPLMMARSLSTLSIVEAQERAGFPYALVQPLGLALYLASALLQTYRRPFAEPFADAIGGGVLGVFGGAAALAWRVALSGIVFASAAMGAVLYLGGPAGPWLPGPVWMAAKTVALLALMLWAGARLRPRSTAETLGIAWKVLVPVGLLNVLVVGGLILLGVGQAPFAEGAR
jgi:NADH-quinone oxidoreductase subunit H